MRILRFPGWNENQPDEKGREIFSTDVPLQRFLVQINGFVHGLIRELGDEEYEARWGRPIPAVELARLREILRERKMERS